MNNANWTDVAEKLTTELEALNELLKHIAKTDSPCPHAIDVTIENGMVCFLCGRDLTPPNDHRPDAT